jgi:hypothetical protein
MNYLFVGLAVLYWLLFAFTVVHAADIYWRHKILFYPQTNTLALLLASWIVLAGTYLAYLHIYHFGSIPLFWMTANFMLLEAVRRYHRHSTERIMVLAAIGIIAGAASLAAGWLPELLNPGYQLARYTGIPVTFLVSFVMFITALAMFYPDIRNKNRFLPMNRRKDDGGGGGDGSGDDISMQFSSVLALLRGSGEPE